MNKDNQVSLAIFANFFIDNEERFLRMKDSFKSFKEIQPNEWIINIRGKHKFQAGQFLQTELGNKLNLSYLNSGFGWFYDSKKIFRNINSKFILNWIEDHIMIVKPEILINCVKEMDNFNVNQLWYSWFIPSVIEPYNIEEKFKDGNFITVRKIDNSTCLKIRNLRKKNGNFKDFCVIPAQTIMEKNFFKKVLFSNKPYLRRRPRKTPHDFEKRSKDKIVKTILNAFPKQELFVSIDDDLFTPGYSLISRGIYPDRVSRKNLAILEDPPILFRKKVKKLIPKKMIPITLLIIGLIYRTFFTLNIFWNK